MDLLLDIWRRQILLFIIFIIIIIKARNNNIENDAPGKDEEAIIKEVSPQRYPPGRVER